MEKEYHIDVSEEEENLFAENSTNTLKEYTKEKAKSPGSYFTISLVVALHLIGVGCMYGLSTSGKGLVDNNTLKEDQEIVKQDQPVPPPQEAPKVVTNPPVHTTETPKVETPPPKQEAPKVVAKPIEAPKTETPPIKPKSNLTKEYVMKNGDTIYGVAKKYKLNVDRLIKLNNIKDANKVPAGKVLKFL